MTQFQKPDSSEMVIALTGNPNVGKSTLFNLLTGMNQHTGNWPGKTVAVASGQYNYKGRRYSLIDLPGTYSLLSHSEEERMTVEYLQSGQANCTLVVGDATCLERSIAFLLQVMTVCKNCIFCVNLLDEAERKGIVPDLLQLQHELGIPVIGMIAATGQGIDQLKETVRNLMDGFISVNPCCCEKNVSDIMQDWNQKESDAAAEFFYKKAEDLVCKIMPRPAAQRMHWFDRIALGKISGRILMLCMLLLVFWITIFGANYPSIFLENVFQWIYRFLCDRLAFLPNWLSGVLLDGVYRSTTRVVSVMLPPICIFFPLFALLEDFGYLPRAAYMMDHCFQKCGTCGKQVLTMSLGFGCNAVGVTGCRIISSPKERLIAILTNALVPCNGKFPAIIAMIAIFFTDNHWGGAGILTIIVLFCVAVTWLTSKILSRFLSQMPSEFILELPPYRRPQWLKTVVRSFREQVFKVLIRAITVAAPAGACLWCLQNLTVDNVRITEILVSALEPVGNLIGLNGVIMLGFLFSLPANELLIPSIVMLLSDQAAWEYAGTSELQHLLSLNGWDLRTAICFIVFMLFHWPCSTTCMTIRKETGAWKDVMAAVLIPTAIGFFLCFLIEHI